MYRLNLHLVSIQSRTCECLNLCFVVRKFKRSYDASQIFCEPYAHKFCSVDIFWNITRRQAISPILGHGFTIQRVILIFIKCLSANHNQLFYMKVKYSVLQNGNNYIRDLYMKLVYTCTCRSLSTGIYISYVILIRFLY